MIELINKWDVVNKLIHLENEYNFFKWDIETLYRKLCELEIEIGKTPGIGWIPVTDRLPDTFGEFIVCVQNADGRRHSDYADFDPYAKKWKTGFFCGEHDKVTHWMPLPEPPSESTVTVEDECNDEDWGC